MSYFIVYAAALFCTVLLLVLFKPRNRVISALFVILFFVPVLNAIVSFGVLAAAIVLAASDSAECFLLLRDTKFNHWLFNTAEEYNFNTSKTK